MEQEDGSPGLEGRAVIGTAADCALRDIQIKPYELGDRKFHEADQTEDIPEKVAESHLSDPRERSPCVIGLDPITVPAPVEIPGEQGSMEQEDGFPGLEGRALIGTAANCDLDRVSHSRRFRKEPGS